MNNSIPIYDEPSNEPVLNYEPGSNERNELKQKLGKLKSKELEIPVIIGGKELRTGNIGKCITPHEHNHILAYYHKAGEKEVQLAIENSLKANKIWNEFSWVDRISIFKKAADLLSTKWRSTLNAATMLCQSKNAYQAEIDAGCELTDFFRFNSYYATKIYLDQPKSVEGVWNRMEYRPLEGFIFAVTPFNFTSISGNLPTAPAIMGNTSLWKPASSAVYSAYFVIKLLQEAGLPDGVINFIPGDGAKIGDLVLEDPNLAGIHFTGSTSTFQNMWQKIGNNIGKYKSYPRIVGETGGKDFVVAHESANINVLVAALIRGAFEYQGQKCSAVSRAYIPRNIWSQVKNKLLEELKDIKVGSPEDFSNFMNAVIDKKAFDKIISYIEYTKSDHDSEIIFGGNYDDSVGYFIEPTVILTNNPKSKTMQEEIFGPVLTIYIYNPSDFEKILKLCDETSPYGLTGAIISQDRDAIIKAERELVNAAGNFYINDKPTGAVVGQQPFGGSRASGTNDKAGTIINLLRWVSARAIKENFVPAEDFRYNFMKNK